MSDLVVYQPTGFLAPVINVENALAAFQAKKDLIDKIMKSTVDYGIIPGTNKPTLLKAGAEKATSFFGLHPIFKDACIVEDWTGENHGGEPFFYYRRTCELYRNGELVASVDGSCNSWEKKYRYRNGSRKCPTCGQEAIIKGKEEYGGGWICFKSKGGCGAKFKYTDPAIAGQEVGQIKNPDVAEAVNTILKMADKRALIAATLIATGMSEYFTQDVEDYVNGEYEEPEPEPVRTAKPVQQTPVKTTTPPIAQPAPSHQPFTLSECENMMTSDGKRYGDLSNADIINRLNAMCKAKNPDDTRLLKIEMTKYLVAARNRGESKEPAGLLETATQLGAVPN